MAERSYLFLPHLEEVEEDLIDPVAAGDLQDPGGTLDPGVAAGDPDPFLPVFPPSDSSDSEDDVNTLALDLFDSRHGDRTPRPASMDLFPDGPGEMGLDYLGLELGLGLGLGSGPDTHRDDGRGGGGGDRGHGDMVPDWGADEFFVGRRSSPSESIEFSRACPLDSEGLRVVRFDSDSDSDEQIVAMGDEQIVAVGVGPDGGGGEEEGRDRGDEDLGLPLCWDCLQLEENRRDPNEEFEWEEVDGRIEERDVLSMMVVGNEEGSNEIREFDGYEVEREEDTVRSIEWEVLLAVNNLGRNPLDPEDVESYFVDDHDGFVYTSDFEAYEVLFGQFAEHDSNLKGSPPAAKSVVESLPSVVLTEEDVANNDTLCAVCKDDISVEERVKRLPCSHHFHEECILPWLGIRNTCPLCRHELPTDDPEYEKWKARRAGGGGGGGGGGGVSGGESLARYDFEMLSEA